MELSPIWKDTFLQILRGRVDPGDGLYGADCHCIRRGARTGGLGLSAGGGSGGGQRQPHQKCQERDCAEHERPVWHRGGGRRRADRRKAGKRLEVISAVTDEEKRQIAAYLEKNCIQVRPAQSELTFDLLLTLRTAEHCVKLSASRKIIRILY